MKLARLPWSVGLAFGKLAPWASPCQVHGPPTVVLRFLDRKPLRGQCDTWDRQVSDVHPLRDAGDNLYTPRLEVSPRLSLTVAT